mmetsp:Transcript_6732/g.13458  ORF Transcript_6732/g.13458 Transcript_6732/m.13458 type:complete len:255 (+) Transcript_6732:1732-2496(+)
MEDERRRKVEEEETERRRIEEEAEEALRKERARVRIANEEKRRAKIEEDKKEREMVIAREKAEEKARKKAAEKIQKMKRSKLGGGGSKFKVGEKVYAIWHGSWYPGSIVSHDSSRGTYLVGWEENKVANPTYTDVGEKWIKRGWNWDRLGNTTTKNQQQPTVMGLPAGWEEKVDSRSGRLYYINHKTRTTQWERPVSDAAAVVGGLFKGVSNGVWRCTQRQTGANGKVCGTDNRAEARFCTACGKRKDEFRGLG